MPDALEAVVQQIEDLAHNAAGELAAVRSVAELESFRVKYLGTKGHLKQQMKVLGTVPKEQRPGLGQRINQVNDKLSSAFAERQAELQSSGAAGKDAFDVTEPGRRLEMGNRHILMKVIDELIELFGRMGFSVASGPEVEDEFHNFVALNIPRQHPARDPLDNFYLAESGNGRERAEGVVKKAELNNSVLGAQHSALRLLRTQTSTVQIRVMEQQKPPIRVVIPGRVYRPDTHDATHLSMFHQLEALVVDKHVTMLDLKSTILQFVKAYFGHETQVRFRPSFFPFTEPSAEVDVFFADRNRWIELGGCGMVHPNVLRAVNLDPEEYSGWAFGFGVERIAMRKYGISDIRLFVENDVRFLRQF